MSNSYDPLYDRALDALNQVPTMKQLLGCVDCEKVFRVGDECPYCESRSIINLAEVIGGTQ